MSVVPVEGGSGFPGIDAGEPNAQGEPLTPEAQERAAVANVLGEAFGRPSQPANLQYTAPTVDGEGGVERSTSSAGAAGGTFANASRNAPCPCGSGRKYKRCHGAPGAGAAV